MLRNPFFWVYLSGAAAGCSLGYLFRRLSKEKSGSTGFALFFSIALLAFSTGIVFSPDFLSSPVLLLLPFTGAVIIGFLIGRFPVASAPPILIVLGSLYLLAYFQIQSEPGIPVHEYPLRISVLRFTDTGSVLELNHRGRAQLIDLESEGFSIEAERITMTPYLPWPRRMYLFARRLVPEAGGTVPVPDFQKSMENILFPGLSETVAGLMGNRGLWRKETLRKGLLNIHLLQSYTIDSGFFRSEEGY